MYQNKNCRKEFWLCLSVVILFFLFNSSYYMWWGGYTFGPRHLVPIIPFLVIPIVFVPQHFWKWIYALIVISLVLMWVGTVVDPQMIPDTSHNPLFGYVFQQFLAGKFSPNMGMSLGTGVEAGTYLLGVIIMIGSAILIWKLERMEKAIK